MPGSILVCSGLVIIHTCFRFLKFFRKLLVPKDLHLSLMNRINLAQYHPIADVQGNIIFSGNGNVVFAYEAILPEIYSLSDKDFEDIHAAWFQALKTLPVGCVVHKQDIYLKSKYASEKLPKNTFLERATHSYFSGRELIEHKSYLFFIYTRNRSLNNSKYVNPFKKINPGILGELDENLKRFQAAVNDSVAFINNSRKITLMPMPENAIQEITGQFFNGFNYGYNTNILLNNDHIEIGNNHFDVLAVNSELCFGESVQTSKTNEKFTSDEFVFHQGFLDGLGLTLNENHIVNQIIYLDDKHKWRKLLDKKIEELNKSSNFGSQNKVTLDKVRYILDQINKDDSSRIVRGHLNITYWDREEKGLDRIGTKIRSELKELDI